MAKSTVAEIQARFNNDVERFADLERGHEAAVDSRLAIDLISSASLAVTPVARKVLDVGCGAGNWSVALLTKRPGLDITLLDIAPAMLERARERAVAAGAASVLTVQSDIRGFASNERFDVIVASAVLHHLRGEEEWRQVFKTLYDLLTPGGSLWIYDLVDHELPEVAAIMKERHGDHMKGVRDESYRDEIFGNIEREDTPRPLSFQLDLLRETGFDRIDVLHKSSRFAAFGASRAAWRNA